MGYSLLWVRLLTILWLQGVQSSPEVTEDCIPVSLSKVDPASSRSLHPTLTFTAGSQDFRLDLQVGEWAVVTEDTVIVVVGTNGTKTLKSAPFVQWEYVGRVNGDLNSYAQGRIDRNGVFDGYFHFNSSKYYLEPYSKYFSNSTAPPNAILHGPVHRLVQSAAPPGCRCASRVQGRESDLDEYLGKIRHTEWQNAQRARRPSQICDLKLVVDYRAYRMSGHSVVKISKFVANTMQWVNLLFRQLRILNPRQSDNIAFFAPKMEVWTKPRAAEFGNDSSATWQPDQFFAEMRAYDFRGYCAGLLFTFRRMDSDSEVHDASPSMFRSSLPGPDRGVCSKERSDLPRSTMSDYGAFVSNALPVNLMLKNTSLHVLEDVNVDRKSILVQALHQLAHLFGAKEDSDFGNGTCQSQEQAKMRVTAYPIPMGQFITNYDVSWCNRIEMANFLNAKGRHCLRRCTGPKTCGRNFDKITVAVNPTPTSPRRRGSATVLTLGYGASAVVATLWGAIWTYRLHSKATFP